MKNAIFGDNTNVNAPVVASIKVTEITPDPAQPRKYFEKQALKELALTIKELNLFEKRDIIALLRGDPLIDKNANNYQMNLV